MKVALNTLGCKLNQAETELLARQFTKAGHMLTLKVDEADVYVLNTCTVTHIADAKSRHSLRLAHRRNPNVLVVATGCYAQRSPQELAQIDGVRLVLGNNEKQRLWQLLDESGYLNNTTFTGGGSNVSRALPFRTRAFIKIQDGCNSFCSYCIVPFVRGREQSLPADQIITDIRERVADGYKEIVLTGTEIGSYNYEGIDLKGLLENILAQTDLTRLRLSSLQPPEISPELIQLWCDRRLCPHFHLSLQSGSDTVLRRMKRRYSTSDYREAVSLIRAQVPDAAITTDMIAGFPGETEEEFAKSLNFCRQMEFARIHVFSYSPRQGTEAAQMPDQVSNTSRKQRSQNLQALSKEAMVDFIQLFSGRATPVLWEKQSGGVWTGLTGNYIRVYTKSNEDLTNKLLPAKLNQVWKDGVWGEINKI